ncbi:MAG: shikimate dehydrogenase [Candidatus Binataceae bacterium]
MKQDDHAPALTGSTLFTGIFGDPVEHSQSPAMHNAAYAALGLERAYLAFHVKPENLRNAIDALAALGILGVNLTVPHKEAALPMMVTVSEEARILGAVNCVINRPGGPHGDNTDARGLEGDLRRLVHLDGQSAIVIGAGGAAASAILACIRMGTRQIVVCNRTVARAEAMVRRFTHDVMTPSGHAAQCSLQAQGLDALLDPQVLGAAAIILNATPMGLKTGAFAPLSYESTPANCFFYDLVYAAKPTPFIAGAAAFGRRTADGAGMLINQGELAFELFNQVPAPSGVMRAALMKRLGRPEFVNMR